MKPRVDSTSHESKQGDGLWNVFFSGGYVRYTIGPYLHFWALF